MANYRVSLSGFDFDDTSIVSGSMNITTAVDLPGSELSSDAFTVILDFDASSYLLFSPSDYDGVMTEDQYMFGTADVIESGLTETPYGTPINFYDGNTLISKFYVHDIERVGRTRYKINAMSAVGFLMYTQHFGGVYSNTTVSDIIDEIVDGAFAYDIDDDVASQKVSGWLPIDTSRNNLHKLMFALGIAITKDSNGDVVFTFLNDDNGSSVGDDRIYIGGSVNYNTLATSVEVTEHVFYRGPNTQLEQIFTNTGGIAADHLFIPFSDPYYDVQSNDLTVNESGDNYAIVSGVGTLSGKPYTHDTTVYSREIEGSTAIVPNVVTSDEDTLINSINVLSVLDRLTAYYGSRKTVNADIIIDAEKAGSVISFTDAFGESTTGIISQMDMNVSSIIKAGCKIITNYTPTGQGNRYQNRKLITSNGTWTVPNGVTTIRVALIGGGSGGSGGYDGEIGAGDDYDPSWGQQGDMIIVSDRDEGYLGNHYGNQPVKNGGNGGEPGTPGKTYVIDATVTPGEIITFAIGSGGSGGAKNGGAGSAGTETTASSTSLGAISSSNGARTDAGYYDVLGGQVYAAAGKSGYKGCSGGQTDTYDLNGWAGYDGLSGEEFDGTYHGGAGGTGTVYSYDSEEGIYRYRASGGGGGGAAYGANGGAGGNGIINIDADNYKQVTTGSGGAGANALPPPTAYYGCAGDGGNGGGAGGNAGGGYSATYWINFNDFFTLGSRGTAGNGSVGGQGGSGCAIIYW